MSFSDTRPLDPWRWIGVPTLLCLGLAILFAIPARIEGFQLPEPVFPLVPAFAWAMIRPSMLAPFVLFGMGLFLDLLWYTPIGFWGVSILVGYAMVNFFRSVIVGQSRAVLAGWYGLMVLLVMATGYFITVLDTGRPPSILATFLQFLPTVLLFPFTERLVDRFEDADVRFR